MFKRVFAILVGLHAAWAWAEPENTLTETDYFAEQPVVLTWLTLSQSWVRTRAEADKLRESTPSHTLSLLANHDFGPVTGSLGYYRVSDMSWSGTPETPAYDRLDMRLARAFRTATLRGEWALVGQSILGEYADFRADRMFEPRAYVYLKLHL